MDLTRYSERAAHLVNARLDDLDDLRAFLRSPLSLGDPSGDEPGRGWLAARATRRDLADLRAFADDLRPVFVAAGAGRQHEVVRGLNALLEQHPVSPRIVGDGPDSWHLHVAGARRPAELVVAEALFGLSTLVCDRGTGRLGVCAGSGCDHVYVDTSPNTSRRYCTDRCASRANVAAFRARKKASLS
ncbi:CGNR zinc finger domain-containing protein [Solicola sp. PLA-1-18]|uniref:CGNR zinc finger domain-containing protein n=1 Tax=Solicola sp. PLA-1-18 TaxID=3380532 RepID=UPI003B81A240